MSSGRRTRRSSSGEGCPYRDGEHEREHRGRGGPAVAADVDQPVDGGGGPGGDQHRAGYVQAPLRRLGRRPGGHGQRYRDEQGDADRHVDCEHPPPARLGGEHAAQDDAQRRPDAGQRRPHPECLAAAGAGEQRHHGGQRGRGHQRRAKALQRPPGEQRRGVAGQPAQQRRRGEQGQAGQGHPPGAEQVGDPAAEQHQAAEEHGVDRHHPRQLAALQVQGGADIRQRHVHHRDVQDEHQLRGREQGQRHPAGWEAGLRAALTRSTRHG